VSPGDPPLPPRGIELFRVRAALVAPHRSARTEQLERESILVRWARADGVDGWAECPTLGTAGYATETTAMAWSALVHELAPAALAGRSPTPVGAPAAAAAMIDARLDARLRSEGTALSDWLAGRAGLAHRTSVPWCAVLADVDMAPGDAADRATAAVARGAAMVKLKVAGGRADSVPRARDLLDAVRAAVEVPVAADANGTLSAEQVAALDDLGLAYLEQPLPVGTTWDRCAGLCASTSTPLALDESLTSLDAVHSALLAGAADVVSVKPARMGGLAAAAAAVALASARGVACFVGGMFELGVGRAAALAVAGLGDGGRTGCTLPTDLGPSSRYVSTDICAPLVTGADGRVVVPTGPGSGRRPDAAALAAATVDRLLLGVT
jgi:o-succinylbenzoate synthase